MSREQDSQLRQTIRISITEGLFSQLYAGLAGPGSVFVTKLAGLLQAQPFHYGMLFAIGQLSQIFQPLGVAVTRGLTARKRAVITLAALGRGLTPLFGLIPLLFGRASLGIFLAVFFLATSLLAMAANAWMGWIGDMVPTRIRGRFFAKRNSILMVIGLLGGYLFAAAIDLFDQNPGPAGKLLRNLLDLGDLRQWAPWAFFGLFCAAGALGIAGLFILRKQPEREKDVETEALSSMLLTPLRDHNFRRLAVWGIWWMLAIGIGAPFWQPFMIENLRMSVLMIMIYGTIATFAGLASLRAWGRLIDRHGNKNSMRIATVMSALSPVPWLFADPSRLWLIYCEAILSGVLWSGAGIVATNFVLSIAPAGKQQSYSGVFAAISGLGMVTTMLVFSAVMPPPVSVFGLNLHPMQVLFFGTAVARMSALIPLSRISEDISMPFTAVVRWLQQYAAVRVIAMTAIISRRKGAGEDPGDGLA
jgi:Na+/melibiose symporter-like transporter